MDEFAYSLLCSGSQMASLQNSSVWVESDTLVHPPRSEDVPNLVCSTWYSILHFLKIHLPRERYLTRFCVSSFQHPYPLV